MPLSALPDVRSVLTETIAAARALLETMHGSLRSIDGCIRQSQKCLDDSRRALDGLRTTTRNGSRGYELRHQLQYPAP